LTGKELLHQTMSKFVIIVACALALLGSAARAQGIADLANRFARATITQNEKPLLKGVIFKDSDDKLITQGAALSEVIARAYGVNPHQVVDAPEWVYETHLYDIQTVPPPAQLVLSDDAQMLQSLLADRFKLQIRRETRGATLLVLAVDAVRQRELDDELQRQIKTIKQQENVFPPTRARIPDIAVLVPEMLANSMAQRVGEPVLDLTGLPHVYFDGEPRLIYQTAPEALNFGTVVAMLRQSGVLIERRGNIPQGVVVVTAMERPRLDVIDR
jgi:uncharacterized protein (TIGR03435 family)